MQERILALDIELKFLHGEIVKKLPSSTVQPTDSLSDKTAYLDRLVKEIAPEFLKADDIMNFVPVWPLGINAFSACFCMGCSAIYHLFLVKSPEYNANLARLDYGGISVLIFGSCVPVLYYAMACK